MRAEAPEGLSVAEILDGVCSEAVEVRVGGAAIPAEWWRHVRPKAGTLLEVVGRPRGEMDEQTAKTVGTVATILVLVAATVVTGGILAPLLGPAFAAGGLGALLGGAAISVGGRLAINALIKPSQPALPAGRKAAGGSTERALSITGTGNNPNPYGSVPCVVGDHLMFPPLAAMPFSETVGQDQYLRMALDLGYGDLDVSQIRIGPTDLSTFAGTNDLEYEVGETPSLFADDVDELSVNADLADGGAFVERTTSPTTDEIRWTSSSRPACSG